MVTTRAPHRNWRCQNIVRRRMPAKPKPPPPATASSSSDSESSRAPTVRTRRRTARAAGKRSADLAQQSAFEAVVLTKRKNHIEAALDLHRRRKLAAALVVAPDPPVDNLWTSFLVDQAEVEREEPPLTDDRAGPARPTPPPAHLPAADNQSKPRFCHAPTLEDRVQSSTRGRPIKGTSKHTAAGTRAAVSALLGRPTKTRG